jgi:predicted permease
VANLLLARAAAREKETAVRAALGAGRGQLVREALAESLVLALAGGALGVLLCAGFVRGLVRLGAGSVPRLSAIAVSPDVLLFTLVVSVLSGLLFGLLPALRQSEPRLQGSLTEGARGSSSGRGLFSRRDRPRRLLVAAEIAVALVVLVGAGLLLRSYARILQVPPGFDPRGVLSFELALGGPRYKDPTVVLETYRELQRRFAALPGVNAAGAVTALPLSQMMAWGPITVEGRALAAGEAFINTDIRVVLGSYFAAMKIPLRKGRLFDEHDTRDKERVIVVDEAFAAQIWPGQDPIGRRVRSGGFDANADTPWLTVVGVVGNVKQDRLDAGSRIALYHPHSQYPARSLTVTLRAASDPAGLAPLVRRELAAVDADLPVYGLRTMSDRVSGSLARRRFSMLLLGLFALLSLALGAIGTYGLLSYQVSQGRRELGIRLALGATPAGLVAFVMREGMRVALAGVAVGLALGFAFARALRSLLFGVGVADPLTFASVPAVLLVVAVAACYLPARRAAAVDPVTTLRAD